MHCRRVFQGQSLRSLAIHSVHRPPILIHGQARGGRFLGRVAPAARQRKQRIAVLKFDSHYDLAWEPRYWAGSQWARCFEGGYLDPANFAEIGIRGTRNSLAWHEAEKLFGNRIDFARSFAHRARRALYAGLRSLQLLASRLPSRAFRAGAGYARDPATHGGLVTWIATRERQCDELRAFGFEVERVLPAPSPDVTWPWAVAWYYYACRKAGERAP